MKDLISTIKFYSKVSLFSDYALQIMKEDYPNNETVELEKYKIVRFKVDEEDATIVLRMNKANNDKHWELIDYSLPLTKDSVLSISKGYLTIV